MLNRYITVALLCLSTFFWNQSVFAQEAEAANNSSNGVSEKAVRELFQGLQNFLALTELKRIETQNVMRLMLPPYVDQTMTTAARVAAAEDAITPWQETLVRDTANYNMNTPEEDSSDTKLLGDRLKAALETTAGTQGMIDPYIGLNDLLASSLLSGHAFENDAAAHDAYQYIRHLTNNKPLAAMTEEEIFSDYPDNTILSEKGGKHLTQIYNTLPAMTLAQNSLLAIHAEKQRFKEFGAGLPIGDPNSKSASLMEVLAYEVDRRYMSSDWHNEMNQMSSEGLLREIANMLAFQMYLDFKRYEQGQRMEAMMAAQIGVMSNILGPMTGGVPPEFEQMTEGQSPTGL